MARALTITIADAIALLNARLAEADKHETERAEASKVYDAAMKDWQDKVAKIAVKLLKDAEAPSVSVRRLHGLVNACDVTLVFTTARDKFPEQPAMIEPKERRLHPWERAEVEGTIKLLTLHTEPTVTMGTLSKVRNLL